MTPDKLPDVPPEMPSLKQDNGKKGGGLPLFGRSSAAAGPMFKLRGLGGASSLMERLKQFKKKDLAFIASGLGVLVLAPIAEHYLLGPDEQSSVLQQGFDSKGNPFSGVSAPFEPGAGGFSPGGLPGQSTDIITPLNVRDPSALIWGPGAVQQPSAGAAPPAQAGKPESSWKDALSEGARKAGDSPFNKAALAGAIRGLSALSGSSYGGGPAYTLPPISASNVPNRPEMRGSLAQVQGSPGYKGVAPRGLSQASGGYDALKAAAEGQGGMLNRGGSASGNLESAAREAMPTGRGESLGGPGGGASGKDPGASQKDPAKSLGESLAFLKAKMEMEKALELKWKRKEWEQFERGKMIQTELVKAGMEGFKKAFVEPFAGLLADILPKPDAGPVTICFRMEGGQVVARKIFSEAEVRLCKKSKEGEGRRDCDVVNDPIRHGWSCDRATGEGKGGAGGGGGTVRPATMQPAVGSEGPDERRKKAEGLQPQIAQGKSALEGRLGELRAKTDEACKGDQGGPQGLCQQLRSLHASVKQAIPAWDKLQEAHDHISSADDSMAQAVGGLNTALTSLQASLVKLKSVVNDYGAAAAAKLAGGDRAGAKTALESARTAHVDSGALNNGGALAPAVGSQAPIEEAVRKARVSLNGAESALSAGWNMLEKAESAVDGVRIKAKESNSKIADEVIRRADGFAEHTKALKLSLAAVGASRAAVDAPAKDQKPEGNGSQACEAVQSGRCKDSSVHLLSKVRPAQEAVYARDAISRGGALQTLQIQAGPKSNTQRIADFPAETGAATDLNTLVEGARAEIQSVEAAIQEVTVPPAR